MGRRRLRSGLRLGLVPILFAAVGLAGSSLVPVRAGSAAGAAVPALRLTESCGQLRSTQLSALTGSATTITSAKVVTKGARYCEVKGTIAPQLKFDLRLPTSGWQGQYVQEGCGGYCGQVTPASPLSAVKCPAVTGHHLALATDNEGHVSIAPTAGQWAVNHPALRISFGYTSEHLLALAAKALIGAYYGRPPTYSYFDGCSDGGREALVEAQRYPLDFNGILAGRLPAALEAELNGEFETWLIEANTNAAGHQILPSQKLPALHAAVVRACGGKDHFIVDPRTCSFNPQSLLCPLGLNTNSCLTAAQVTAVTAFYRGPSDPQGQSLYPGGEPYGSELAWATWMTSPAGDRGWPVDTGAFQLAYSYLKYMAYPAEQPASFAISQFTFDLSSYQQLATADSVYDASNPDLSAFAAAGGKLIMYQGWADQSIPPFSTVAYDAAVVTQAGGFAASQAFSRLFMVPAQYHCLIGGSPPVVGNLLNPLLNWVQKGVAPGAVSFPLVKPTTHQKAISVAPFNPLTPVSVPAGKAAGLNASYDWVGSFSS